MGKKAFLVDDSKSARIVLGRLLTKNGFDDVVMAESGEEALEKLSTHKPDAIFVDFLMEGMDGLETISEIRKDERFQKTPIVMCTANEGDRYVQAAVEHGALGILAKPPTDDSLKAIMQLIEQNQQAEEAPPLQAVATSAGQTTLSADEVRSIALEAAKSLSAADQEQTSALVRKVAHQAAKESISELLEPMVASLVEKRMEQFKPPEVDTESLKDEVVNQVNTSLEDFIRQINERTVEGLIEASIYEQVQELANDFSKRLGDLKEEILLQVPEKNDMIEHIRLVTEGAMEAHVREVATQVSQEISNSIATETVEQILDEHLADQAISQSINNSKKKSRVWPWVLLLLAGAAGGYAVYFYDLLAMIP